MSGHRPFERILRWYPPVWRDRYGDELVALLEDTYGGTPPPRRARLGLVRAALVERLRQAGLSGGDPADQVRSGSVMVLWAWAAFVVAGAGFAKFAEHWDAATPPAARRLPADAYGAVQWAAGVGAAAVAVAIVVTLPALIRFLGDGGWRQIRRPVGRAAIVAAATAVATVGLVAWAHHIGPAQRNGPLVPYAGAGALWALMVVASIGTCTAAATSAARRLRLDRRVTVALGVLALLAALAMVAIAVGTLVWWGAVAVHAPWFLSGEPLGVAGSPAPPLLVGAGLLMALGLAVAAGGAHRVARSLRRAGRS